MRTTAQRDVRPARINAPAGAVVVTIAATWGDGAPFTGTLSFRRPCSNDNATFAICGNSLIVNSAGPAVSAGGETTTQ